MTHGVSLLVGCIFLVIFTIFMVVTVLTLYSVRREREKELKLKLLIHYYLGPIGFFVKEEKNKLLKNIASSITTVAYISLFVVIAIFK